jgi:hypothetical protein
MGVDPGMQGGMMPAQGVEADVALQSNGKKRHELCCQEKPWQESPHESIPRLGIQG